QGHRGTWFKAPGLSGACLLIKRRVIDAVGGLDERPGPGSCDDDLPLRARRAGFDLAVARDLFVHHFGCRASDSPWPERTIAAGADVPERRTRSKVFGVGLPRTGT